MVDERRDDESLSAEKPAAVEPAEFYDDNGDVARPFLDDVRAVLEAEDAPALLERVEPLHETELGDLIEHLETDERQHLVRLLGEDFDYTALTEIDEAVRLEIVDAMPNEQIAEALLELDSDDAVYILEDLEEEDRKEILERLPFRERLRLRRALEYPEETAGRRMQTEFVAVPPFWTVGQTIDYMREDDDLPDRFAQIFVVDPTFKLLGSVDLHAILRTKRPETIESIMHPTRHAIPAEMDQEEAAQVFEQYDLLSAAVVDENERLVGVLTIDDIVDVIQAEAEEDFRLLGGVGDEEISDSVRVSARSRFPWLFVNLGTAFLAALVIGLFDATIQQMVALAALMPIVASMGGNAAAQTMTVTVRAIATRDIHIHNSGRIIRRELLVGLLNGSAIAVLIGCIAWAWIGSSDIGLVIGTAMLINMVTAALAGILIPLVLNKFGADPAIASAVFVTAVTDVVGFFGFLGLATWWFGLA
ncbi:magnesium transporter [Aureimonas mangrovi]|uniref:magnesium transporter n=1 Tax=Aureimonas mangrovi TaxID=2758041 RepID=UPI00163D3FE7|nr:magnesium transporter [Aureimonas mangrovi]